MLKSLYRSAAGTFIALSVVIQYWLLVRHETLAQMMGSSVRFFSFFTIVINTLAAVALLVPVLAPRSSAARFLERPSVRTAIAGYIIIVGVVYHLLLRGVSQREGWPLFFEIMLHYVTPPLFVLDWLLFVPKRGIGWRVGIDALPFPLAYLGWILVHGALTGWYPYPFIDVPELGYAQVLTNIVGLIVSFLVVEALLVALSRVLDRPKAGGATTPAP